MKLLAFVLLFAVLGSVISRPPPNRRKIGSFLHKVNEVIRHKRADNNNPTNCPPKKVYNPTTQKCEKVGEVDIGFACCLGGLGK